MSDQKHIKDLLLAGQWEVSFSAIVEQYSENLYRCALSITGDHEEANDVLQEAFINIWKNLHKFKGDSQPYTWCYSIVKNQSLNALKKMKKRQAQSLDTAYGITSSGELPMGQDEIEALLEAAIAGLPEKQRIVFEMRYYHETPFAQMSQLLETSEGALKASYHIARKRIEEKLKVELNLLYRPLSN